MTSFSPGSRARNSLLAAAVAESGMVGIGAARQPTLFEGPRLSDHVWLALATCEAIARNGGRIGGDQAAAVLREWLDGRRFHNAGTDAMQPIRDLAAGVPWQRTGVSDGPHLTTVMRVMPLAFVIDLAHSSDRALLDEVVRITSLDPRCFDDARTMIGAIRNCIEHDAVPDLQTLPAASTLQPSLARALRIAAESGLDLEVALAASGPESDEGTAAMIGFLLGAAGCTIPAALADALPERAAVDDVLEPFAQLVAGI